MVSGRQHSASWHSCMQLDRNLHTHRPDKHLISIVLRRKSQIAAFIALDCCNTWNYLFIVFCSHPTSIDSAEAV
jgi:hypothetical protein